jgi:hypothetical protein
MGLKKSKTIDQQHRTKGAGHALERQNEKQPGEALQQTCAQRRTNSK